MSFPNPALITVTLHAAVDLTATVPGFTPGAVLKASEYRLAASGKGWNVGRAATSLGLQTRSILCVGPDFAQLFRDDTPEGLDLRLIDTATTTRVNITLLDGPSVTHVRTSSGRLAGSVVCDEVRAVLADIADSKPFVLFSGSLPPGMTRIDFGQMLEHVQSLGCDVGVDSSDHALREAVDRRVSFIKPNRRELQDLLRRELSIGDLPAASREVGSAGVATVIASSGSDGAYGYEAGRIWHARYEGVCAIRSDVGAGDALVAGYLNARLNGSDLPSALGYGVATATASLSSFTPAEVSVDLVEQALPRVAVAEI